MDLEGNLDDHPCAGVSPISQPKLRQAMQRYRRKVLVVGQFAATFAQEQAETTLLRGVDGVS
jgi:hypothetical protein